MQTTPIFKDKILKSVNEEMSIEKNGFQENIFIRPPKILIVEDHPVIQTLTIRSLLSLGCSVRLAENAETAINMFIDGYDLIFSDIGLPDGDGKEIARCIRQYEYEKGTRNILIAVTSQSSELESCLQSGFDDFYVKPLCIGSMRKVLMHWLPHLVKSSSRLVI